MINFIGWHLPGADAPGTAGRRYRGRTADALAWEAEEGRGKLR